MKSSDYNNLRWCERYKNSLVYQHVQAFAKKLRQRKFYQNQHQIINADIQQRQIDMFYKVGWEYQHVHASMSSDISDPIYVQQQPSSQLQQNIHKYYEDCKHFIQRHKTQHQDQTVFRVDARWTKPIIPVKQLNSQNCSSLEKKYFQNLICSKQAYNNFMETTYGIVESMISNIQGASQLDIQLSPYWKVKQIYQIIYQWLDYLKCNSNNQQTSVEWLQKIQEKAVYNIHVFMVNAIDILEKIKNEKRSCLFNYQPQISALTYIIHPLLLTFYSFHYKQRIIWQNQYEHNILNINFANEFPKNHLLQNTKHYQLSRTVFINLDGHQSQFNIEFAKNFPNHLMYVSFPKFTKNNTDENLSFNGRFFKKIFYKYCRDLYQFQNEDFDVIKINNDKANHDKNSKKEMQVQDQQYEMDMIRRQLQLKSDPQKYFSSISRFYKEKSISQSNSNIYIFPLCFKYLQQQLSTLFYDNNIDAAAYTSYFIYFLMKDFIIEDIKKFNPQFIFISYNGQLSIKDQHFIKLMQELAGICRRKLLFFPNFTTRMMSQSVMEDPYDNFIEGNKSLQNSCDIHLMRKMSQFLKISSGTYNLDLPKDHEDVISRFKLAKITTYIRGLMNALSNQQYPQFKNRISDLALRAQSVVFQRTINQTIKDIKNSTPVFYQQLISHINNIISGLTNDYPHTLRVLVQQIRNQIRTLAQIGNQGLNNKDNYIADIIKKMQLEIVSEKFSEVAYVYFKIKQDKVQFQELKQQLYTKFKDNQQQSQHFLIKQANNLQGLYSLSFRYKNQKFTLPIYPNTQLLYRQNQTHKFRTGDKKYANIMLMNHLEQNQFISYAGLVPLISQYERQQKKIMSQRIQMYPIVFNNMPALSFKYFGVRSAWNYAQTNRYYFLYWPVEYNYLQARLRQIKDEIYEPRVLSQIYICEIPQKKQHRLVFNRVLVAQTEAKPRKFCNSLSLMDQNKIFILGGFYDRQDNYLSLQNEITGLDLSLYNTQNHKCIVTNQKNSLYQNIEFKRNSNRKQNQQPKCKNNSYVRARREYEVYELEQLCDINEVDNEMIPQNIKTYILLGGYGQDFIRPYSLMSCNYYSINVNIQTKSICSIERKMVYQKLLTSNIKGYIKNNGYYQYLTLYQKNCLKPNERLSPDQYVAHRSVYSLKKQLKSNGQFAQELHIKTKYLFAFNIYNNFKKQYLKFASKIGEYFDSKNNQSSQFFLSFSAQGSHYLTIRKNKAQQQIIPIYLQKNQAKSKFQIVPLTHGSIISIDIRFKQVYAIIKHELHTSGKYVLAHCQMTNQQSEAILKFIQVFNENLEQYYLFSPRNNEVFLLHGLNFEEVKISDYLYRIAKKENSKQNPIKKIATTSQIDSKKVKKICTLMVKGQNKQTKSVEIQSYNLFLPLTSKPQFYNFRKDIFKLQNTEFVWHKMAQYPITFIGQQDKTTLHIHHIEQTRILQKNTSQNPIVYSFSSPTLTSIIRSSQNAIIIKFVSYNKQSYIGMLNQEMNDRNSGQFIKIICVGADYKDAKRLWQLALPVQHNIKSMNKYQDMDIF